MRLDEVEKSCADILSRDDYMALEALSHRYVLWLGKVPPTQYSVEEVHAVAGAIQDVAIQLTMEHELIAQERDDPRQLKMFGERGSDSDHGAVR
jgi:hypothetical protein